MLDLGKSLESSVSASQDQDYKCVPPHPAFPMDVVNLNSGPHAYTESILPSEHLPSPRRGFIFESNYRPFKFIPCFS